VRVRPVSHLTREQHIAAARLLDEAQKALGEVARIVARAPYVDRYLDVGAAIQEFLIDPLKAGWEAQPRGPLERPAYRDDPYKGIYYISRSKVVRRQIRRKAKEARHDQPDPPRRGVHPLPH